MEYVPEDDGIDPPMPEEPEAVEGEGQQQAGVQQQQHAYGDEVQQ